VKATVQLGYPERVIVPIGIVQPLIDHDLDTTRANFIE
jgi:hypothetical protein